MEDVGSVPPAISDEGTSPMTATAEAPLTRRERDAIKQAEHRFQRMKEDEARLEAVRDAEYRQSRSVWRLSLLDMYRWMRRRRPARSRTTSGRRRT